jgi:hypothetical protein
MNSKYFLQEDLKETLTTQRYSQTRERVTKPSYRFNSGSVYTGEWRGGFRDGHGEQVWPDGARYVGEWKDHHAHG